MKFVYCNGCGTARDHIELSNGNYKCLVCERERQPLHNNNPNIRINVDPEVTKLSENLPLRKHFDEVIILKDRKRGRLKL